MFNPDPTATTVSAKLPKAVIMMIEKNNLVMAIKTLAADENISMDAAKARIDAYETQLKVKQQQQLTTIANKQGIPSSTISSDETVTKEFVSLTKDKVKSTPSEAGFKSLQRGVDSQLRDLGYKKPLVPHWFRRVLVIVVLILGLFLIFRRTFG